MGPFPKLAHYRLHFDEAGAVGFHHVKFIQEILVLRSGLVGSILSLATQLKHIPENRQLTLQGAADNRVRVRLNG